MGMTKQGEHTMGLVRGVNAEILARTGYQAYQYTSDPGDGLRIVFGDEVVPTPAEAYAKILAIREAVNAGVWDKWNCRHHACPRAYLTEGERDEHERVARHWKLPPRA
jgi:hypothetical protein